jgi:hypothetical protein
MYVNLNNGTFEGIETGNDSIVIVENLEALRGGRALDVTGFTPEVIQAGHLIIRETATRKYKPMPVALVGRILTLGSLVGGTLYTDGTYNNVAITDVGAGTLATANVVVEGGVVTSVEIVLGGSGYAANDALSIAAASIGGTGSGLTFIAATVGTDPAEYAALPALHTYAGILVATILTEKAFAGIMVRGTVNRLAGPYPVTSAVETAFKAAMPLIRWTDDGE